MTGPAPDGATAALGLWVSTLSFEAVPDPVTAHIKLCLLDALGCALFGSRQPWGTISAEVAATLSPGGTATLIGSGRHAGPADAAMANGTAVHGFEIDDAHTASSLHPGAVVIPAVLALAEGTGATGRETIAAIAAGYEAGLRLGVCAGLKHSTSGFHVTGTVGSFAAAAGAARALSLSPDATTHALGIGATQASGLYCARFGAMTKRFHAGRGAQSGVLAALLAQKGFTGATDVVEATNGGFLAAFGGDHPAASMLDGLGERWETARVGFKLHCACASAHTTVDAVLAMRANGLRSDRLKSLQIFLGRKGFHNIGWRYVPADIISAQMNGSYAAAVALIDGEVSVRQYTKDRLTDPEVLAVIDRIECRHDQAIDAGGAEGRHKVIVVAETTDGETMTETVAHRTGSPQRPLTRGQIEGKFRALADSAGLRPNDAQAIVDMVARMECLDDISQLTARLRLESTRAA